MIYSNIRMFSGGFRADKNWVANSAIGADWRVYSRGVKLCSLIQPRKRFISDKDVYHIDVFLFISAVLFAPL